MTPPTDSIYKFLCVLAGSSVGLLLHAADKIDEHAETFFAATQEYRTLTIKFIEETNKAKAYARESGGLDGLDEVEKAKFLTMLDSSDPLQERLHEIEEPYTMNVWLFQKRVSTFELTRSFAITGIVGGATLFIAGLILWYKKVQVHIDEKTQNAKV